MKYFTTALLATVLATAQVEAFGLPKQVQQVTGQVTDQIHYNKGKMAEKVVSKIAEHQDEIVDKAKDEGVKQAKAHAKDVIPYGNIIVPAAEKVIDLVQEKQMLSMNMFKTSLHGRSFSQQEVHPREMTGRRLRAIDETDFKPEHNGKKQHKKEREPEHKFKKHQKEEKGPEHKGKKHHKEGKEPEHKGKKQHKEEKEHDKSGKKHWQHAKKWQKKHEKQPEQDEDWKLIDDETVAQISEIKQNVHEKTLQWLDETFDHVQKKVDDQEFDKKIDAVKEKHQEAKERRKKQTQAVVHKKVEKMKKFVPVLMKAGMQVLGPAPRTPPVEGDKVKEIAGWFKAVDQAPLHVSRWITLDSGDLSAFGKHHIPTKPGEGLTDKAADRALEILVNGIEQPSVVQTLTPGTRYRCLAAENHVMTFEPVA